MEKSQGSIQSSDQPEKATKKVALVHDFLLAYGGAERVFEEIARMYPEAPIYTLLARKEITEKHFKGREIRTSWLSTLPKFLKSRYRLFLPFFPTAVESFDLRDFDLVITSSGAWSKGIVTRLHTRHIAYIHSPMRYAWDYHEEYLRELGARGARKLFTRMLVSYLRIWDRQAALRPDVIMANSRFTAERIKKYYVRDSTVVYPGGLALSEVFGRDDNTQVPERSFFLVVARLTASKKVEQVIHAFNKLGLALVIVGTGAEKEKLEKMAEKNIAFRGFVDDKELADLYRQARALIFPSEEDFGMIAVEALSFGTPVIALDYGGVHEILTEGKNGEFFHSATPELIAEGVRRFLLKEGTYDQYFMKDSVKKFSIANFRQELKVVVENG